MGSCLASVFKGGGGGGRGKYGPLRTPTTARYGTNSRNQSYMGAGHSGRRVEGGQKKGRFGAGSKGRSSSSSSAAAPSSSSSASSAASSSRGGALSCPSCGYTTSSKRDMHNHIAAQHGGKVKRPPRKAKTGGGGGSGDHGDHGDHVGGKAGDRARSLQWSDLHKSESELAAEQFAREHPEFEPPRRASDRSRRHTNKKSTRTSRLKAASERAGSLVRSARSTISSGLVTRGTRGVSNSTRAKKSSKKKKKRKNDR